MPFTVTLERWAKWARVLNAPAPGRALLARVPSYVEGRQGHNDLFALDDRRQLWHRRLRCGNSGGVWSRLGGAGPPDWSQPFSWAAASDRRGITAIFVISGGRLLRHDVDAGGGWEDLRPRAGLLAPIPVPLGPGSVVTAVPNAGFEKAPGVRLCITGADGNVYTHPSWRPEEDAGHWERVAAAGGPTIAPGSAAHFAAGRLFVRDAGGDVWLRPLEGFEFLGQGWRALGNPGFPVGRLAVTGEWDRLHLAVGGSEGEVRVGELRVGAAIAWAPPATATGWAPAPGSELAWASPEPGQWWLFVCGSDGSVRVLKRSDGDLSAGAWETVGSGGEPFAAGPRDGLGAVSRARGQVELFAQGATGAAWTWWS